MANYLIIGGDGKEYGPVTEADVRQWIAEGRLNAQSQAKAESDAEFRTLAQFPEFADAFTPGASAPSAAATAPAIIASQLFNQVVGGREAALQLIKGPAIALKVTAIIGLVLVAIGFAVNIAALTGHPLIPQQPLPDPELQKIFESMGSGLGLVQSLVGGVIGVIVFIGAGKMQKLEGYQFSMLATILAMIPCFSPCCLLGLPFGIWALIVLNKPEVKAHFS